MSAQGVPLEEFLRGEPDREDVRRTAPDDGFVPFDGEGPPPSVAAPQVRLMGRPPDLQELASAQLPSNVSHVRLHHPKKSGARRDAALFRREDLGRVRHAGVGEADSSPRVLPGRPLVL